MAKQSNWIVVEAEIDAVQKALEKTSKSFTSIQKQALGIIARKGVQFIRRDIKSTILHPERSTGELQKAYGFRVRKDGSEANIYPKGESGSAIFPKAFINNYGIDKEKMKRSPKGFIERTENLLDENTFENDLQTMVNKTLDRYWG